MIISKQLILLTLLATSSMVQAASWDMAQWMGQLDNSAAPLLQDVLLPGSHDAGAYQIMGSSQATCGNADLAGIPDGTLGTLLSLEQAGSINLVETQRVSVKEQLELGIRFLDLRLGWHQGDVYLHHTLFMDVTLQQVLQETSVFLDQYDTEVVILKLRLQCGTPLGVTLDALETNLGASYGGPLTPTVMSSPINQIQGLAFVVFDETDGETAEQIMEQEASQSVQPDEYYQVYPCQEDPIATSKLFGASEDTTCNLWPDYTQNQGQQLHENIVKDSAVKEGTHLADWKPFTTSDSLRILSFLGIIPFGKGCDPSSTGALGLALLSCKRIGIDSYTETFQEVFLELLMTLESNQMMDAINVIQVDYVDGFPLEALLQFNGHPMVLEEDSNSTALYNNVTDLGFGQGNITEEKIVDACWNHDYSESSLCSRVCQVGNCCFDDDPEMSCQAGFPCYKYIACSVLYANASLTVDEGLLNDSP